MIVLLFLRVGCAQEQDAAKRIHAHLLIDDPYSAIAEAKAQLKTYPDSVSIKIALIKALCRGGNEVEALEEWNKLTKTNEELLSDRTALETLAWGVLNKGGGSNQLVIKVNALIGSSMTRDAKAIPLILENMRGSNSMLRAIAVGLAAQYGDLPLQEEIARMLKEEKVWYVRSELIKAIGQLRMTHLKGELLEILKNSQTLAEEKFVVIVALIYMTEAVEEQELEELVKSDRAALRELSCQIILHLDMRDKVDYLLPLLRDANSAVRISALNTLALLGVKELDGKPIMEVERVYRLLNDHTPEVSVTAAWLALLRDDQRGCAKLTNWIQKGDIKYARLAAGALAISGPKGVELAEAMLQKIQDPYICSTLAVGLIGQRQNVRKACEHLDKHFKSKEKWMWDTSLNPLFRRLAPSTVSHTTQIPNYPSVVDQMTRLQLLQILCIMSYPNAQEAVKGFLTTNAWGTVGAAAATLLQEGDDEALDVVRSLLKDPEEKVRIQAALILAMLGGDKTAVNVLRNAYEKAPKDVKIHILEALAKVGDPESMAFLLDRLNEPFQVLRVVAATAIIQCLYH